jgi:hypothetical protein
VLYRFLDQPVLLDNVAHHVVEKHRPSHELELGAAAEAGPASPSDIMHRAAAAAAAAHPRPTLYRCTAPTGRRPVATESLMEHPGSERKRGGARKRTEYAQGAIVRVIAVRGRRVETPEGWLSLMDKDGSVLFEWHRARGAAKDYLLHAAGRYKEAEETTRDGGQRLQTLHDALTLVDQGLGVEPRDEAHAALVDLRRELTIRKSSVEGDTSTRGNDLTDDIM